jgi:hypothetical protein
MKFNFARNLQVMFAMPRHLRGPPVWYTPLEDIFVEHLYRAAWVIYAILGALMPRAKHVPEECSYVLHGVARHLLFLSLPLHLHLYLRLHLCFHASFLLKACDGPTI